MLAAEIALHARAQRNRNQPLMAGLFDAMVAEPALLELAALATPGQPASFLLVAVVNELLLEAPSGRLASCHPLVTGGSAERGEFVAAFVAFCRQHHDELGSRMALRTVQYTTPQRASYVFPAVAHVAALARTPLALIEIGCSAGFNLLFDSYAYDYGAAGSAGLRDSSVVVRCEVRGAGFRPPTGLPAIRSRLGLELRPLDLCNATERRWLVASVWRELAEEQAMLQAAIRLRMATPLEVRCGDALANLEAAIDASAGPPCLFHSCCLYQWSAPQLRQLEELLLALSQRRTIHRLGMESQITTLTAAEIASTVSSGRQVPVVVSYQRYAGGAVTPPQLLARCGGNGEWLEWLAAA
jgi:hypothetical protein